MKELDPAVFVAVFQEMLGGPLFWLLAAGIALTTLAFLYVLIRDRGLTSRRFLGAEALGLAGGAAAVLSMQAITNSGFRDVGGPIDWLLVALIFVLGAVGTTLLVYTLWSLVGGRAAARDA